MGVAGAVAGTFGIQPFVGAFGVPYQAAEPRDERLIRVPLRNSSEMSQGGCLPQKPFARAGRVKTVSLATLRHSRFHAPALRSLLGVQLRRLDRKDASSTPLNVLRDAFHDALTRLLLPSAATDRKRLVEWARVLEPPLRHVCVVVPFPVPHVDEPVREVHFFANVLFWYRWLLAAGSSQAAPVFQDIVCCITYLHLVGGLHPVYAFLERQRVRHGDARQEQCDAPSQAEGRASVRAGAGRGRGRRHRLGLKRWSGGAVGVLKPFVDGGRRRFAGVRGAAFLHAVLTS